MSTATRTRPTITLNPRDELTRAKTAEFRKGCRWARALLALPDGREMLAQMVEGLAFTEEARGFAPLEQSLYWGLLGNLRDHDARKAAGK